jgi:hypothetical protein
MERRAERALGVVCGAVLCAQISHQGVLAVLCLAQVWLQRLSSCALARDKVVCCAICTDLTSGSTVLLRRA